MITLYGIADIFEGGHGETKDLWAHWALEESGLPYTFKGLDQTKGELETPAYVAINPFKQVPALDDDGFVLTESSAIVLYVAEKSGRLIPSDFQGRLRVTQWCFVAMSTVLPTITAMDFAGIFDPDKKAETLHEEATKIAERWWHGLEERVAIREWIATDDFSAADIMTAGILRMVRQSGVLDSHPALKAYYARCTARPAWQRVLEMAATRLGMTVEKLR